VENAVFFDIKPAALRGGPFLIPSQGRGANSALEGLNTGPATTSNLLEDRENMQSPQIIGDALELDSFDALTREEILSLWRTFKASGLSEREAWHAVVTGMALDIAFARTTTHKFAVQ